MKRFGNLFFICMIMLLLICSHVFAAPECPEGATCDTCNSELYYIKNGDTISFYDENPDDNFTPIWNQGSCGTNLFKSDSNIKKVYIEGANNEKKMRIAFQDLFKGYTYINEIHLKNVIAIANSREALMTDTFNGCTALETLVMDNVDLSNVTDMLRAFNGCSALETLDLSNWNTSSMTRTTDMFQGCTNLKTVNLSGWDTSKVTDMSYMFNGCSSLKTVILENSNWATSKVTNFSYMFSGCSALTDSDLAVFNISNWNTSSATNTSHLFEDCTGLTDLDLGSWNVSNVSQMRQMFMGCSALTKLKGTSKNNEKNDFCEIIKE